MSPNDPTQPRPVRTLPQLRQAQPMSPAMPEPQSPGNPTPPVPFAQTPPPTPMPPPVPQPQSNFVPRQQQRPTQPMSNAHGSTRPIFSGIGGTSIARPGSQGPMTTQPPMTTGRPITPARKTSPMGG
jgi:hypothetical protein